MAFDAVLAERVRKVLGDVPDITEKRMFGGIAFMLRGHMFAGIVDSTLMARVGTEAYEAMLSRRHVRVMDFTGKPLRGYVYVDAPGLRSSRDLATWTQRCLSFVATLPGKKAPASRRARPRATAATSTLVGFGPKSASALPAVGVHTVGELQAHDPYDLYRRLKIMDRRVSLNFLYGIIAARDGMHWREVRKTRRLEILLRLEELGLVKTSRHG